MREIFVSPYIEQVRRLQAAAEADIMANMRDVPKCSGCQTVLMPDDPVIVIGQNPDVYCMYCLAHSHEVRI